MYVFFLPRAAASETDSNNGMVKNASYGYKTGSDVITMSNTGHMEEAIYSEVADKHVRDL
jgi:hypothetical protein